MSRVRALSLQLSDAIAHGYGKLGVMSQELSPVTAHGIVAACAQPQHGDYQCNLSMNIKKQVFATEKSKKEKGKEKKGNMVVTQEVLQNLPKLDRADLSTYPDTPRDLSVHLLRELVEGEEMRPKSPLMSSITVAPTGFVNISVNPAYMSERVVDTVIHGDIAAPLMLDRDFSLLSCQTDHYNMKNEVENKDTFAAPRKVAIDYSSPNIAKEMHVGHIRSTVIGDSLSKLLEFLGFQVTRINHVGDWGTQFGMLIEYFAELERGMHGGLPEVLEASYQQTFYRAAKMRFDDDADFHMRAKNNVVKLQGGDVECRELWKRLCKISEVEFNKVYSQLGIDKRLLVRGESSYNSYLEDVVEEMLSKGIAIEDNGAVMLFPPGVTKENIEEYKVDGKIHDAVVLRKSGGGFTYGATDQASLRLRLCGHGYFNEKNKPEQGTEYANILDGILQGGLGQGHEWAQYVVDSGQSLHFDRVLGAGKTAGWETTASANFNSRNSTLQVPSTGTAVRVEHVNFGVVLGANGKRLRTRAGEQIKLADLMRESVDSARDMLLEHNKDMLSTTLEPLAESIGMSSLKYGDLRRNRVSDYSFSFEAMMDLKGDTAVYSMYMHARMSTVLEKALELERYKGKGITTSLKALNSTHTHVDIITQALLEHQQRTNNLDGLRCNVNTMERTVDQSLVDNLYQAILNQDNKPYMPTVALDHVSEQQLALHIAKFQDAALTAATSLQMNAITDYTSTLSSKFAAFYRDCSILNVPYTEPPNNNTFNTQDSRIMLTLAAVYTLRRCFNLIGVDAVKQM